MNLLYQMFFLMLFYIYHACSSVIKKGKKAPIQLDDAFSPLGMMFLKSSYFQWIFPGTKWCGEGDIANHYDDLGRLSETDRCCRAHDFCEDFLFAGQMKETLINTHKFTRLNCNCDLQFYACLGKVTNDKISANLVGISYFDILAPKCYSHLHSATCIRFESTLGLNKRCVEYQYDCTTQPRWQWFDVPKWTTFLRKD